MSCSRSNLEGESSPKEGVVNHYHNSVMAPQKTVCFKEGVMLVEEVKAPKTTGTMKERLGDWKKRPSGMELWFTAASMLITS